MPDKITPEEREAALRERLERIEALEREIKSREKAVKKAENAKKQIIWILRSIYCFSSFMFGMP